MYDFVRRKNVEDLQKLLLVANPGPETRQALLKMLTEEIARLPPPPELKRRDEN
jgi:hypothetical protein